MTQSIALFYRCWRLLAVAALLCFSVPLYASPDRYVLVTLLHTNDMHGTVMPEGGSTGLAKVATLVKQIRADMPNVIFLDAGDIIHGTFEDYLSGGRATISSMNAAGYEVGTLGNHEFDYATNTTRGVISTAVFPFVSANLKDKATGGPWNNLPPYIIKNVDGVRVAVFGLTTLLTVDIQWPPRIADVKFEDPFATAKALVPELRKQADVVVALSHLGFADDKLLAKQVPGIDFIIGGHSHTILDKWTWVDNTMITHAGALAAYLGRIDFIARMGDAGVSIASINGKDGQTWSRLSRRPLDKNYPESPLIPITASVPDDPDVVAAYMPFRQQARMVLDEVIGETPGGITGVEAVGESPAANLVADAVRWSMNSDVATVDPASVAGTLLPGKVTVESAFKLIGGFTRQNLIKVEMTGTALIDLVNLYLTKKKSPPVVVSGMALTYAVDASGTPKVQSITIGGAPLDPQRTYSAASQAYVVMDWQKAHPEIRVTSDPALTTREAIVNFIKDRKIVDYKPEGRVTRVP